MPFQCIYLHNYFRILSAFLSASVLVGSLGSSAAWADAPVSTAARSSLMRAGQTQDSAKNPTAASFGAPVTDDRRLFKLRWRLPWLLSSGGLGPSPFVRGFTATSFAVPGGMSLAAEPMAGLSALIPQLEVGENKKVGHAQLGALSTTVGHGTLVDRYTNSPDGLARRVGAMGDVNLAGAGVLAIVGDILAPQSFLAARLHGRPVMWFMAPDATFQPNELDLDPRTEIAGIWVTGLTAAADFDAPSTTGPRPAVAVGWDNEAALLDNQAVKTILYLDLALLHTRATGVGAHPGLQLMFDFAGVRMDGSAEVNLAGENYQPRYFDRLYTLERNTALADGKPKSDLDRPGSWGYSAHIQAGILEAVTLFGDVRDQQPFDPTRGDSSMTLTAGGSVWLGFFGGSLIATQTNVLDNRLLGPGFVVTAEGRLGVLFNTLHLVGRTWRAHVPAGDSPGDFVVDSGGTMGLEVNFDFL